MFKNISPHFSIAQFEHSEKAIELHMTNNMNSEELSNAVLLANTVLENIFNKVAKFKINSGFRCVALNKAVGGVADSQHCLGEAADLLPITMSLPDFFDAIVASGIPYDQIIFEFGRWVHISYAKNPRKEKLEAKMVNGKAVYSNIEKAPR